MKVIFLTISLLLSSVLFADKEVTSSTQSDFQSFAESISTQELANEIKNNPNLILIDIRSNDEVVSMGGSIKAEQNINIPMYWLTIKEISPNKDTPIVVYCANGLRSPIATETLIKLGYTHVKGYSEGFSGWKKANMPISHY